MYFLRSVRRRRRILERSLNRDPVLDLEVSLSKAYTNEDYAFCLGVIAQIESLQEGNILAQRIKAKVSQELKRIENRPEQEPSPGPADPEM